MPSGSSSGNHNGRSQKIYIGDLGNYARESDVEEAFSKFGALKMVWVAKRPPGFAFVEFEDERDAEDAVKAMDGRVLCGRKIKVELSHGKSRWPGGKPPSYLLKRPAPRFVRSPPPTSGSRKRRTSHSRSRTRSRSSSLDAKRRGRRSRGEQRNGGRRSYSRSPSSDSSKERSRSRRSSRRSRHRKDKWDRKRRSQTRSRSLSRRSTPDYRVIDEKTENGGHAHEDVSS